MRIRSLLSRIPRYCLPSTRVGGFALVLLLGALGTQSADAASQWRDLNGRVAPDLTFRDTALGLPSGSSIAALRGQQVVLLAFWLRDCPHCKREMPQVQNLFDEFGRSGLQVISIVHEHPTQAVTGLMRELGWDFPLASDPDGQMAAAYGGGRRPGFFLVGLDGRVKSSGGISLEALAEEMARFRLAEWGQAPASLEAVRQQVWRGDYGAALRLAEPAAAAATAAEDVKAAVAKLKAIAARKIENRRWRAERSVSRGQGPAGMLEVSGLPAAFEGTSLHAQAKAAVAAIAALLAPR